MEILNRIYQNVLMKKICVGYIIISVFFTVTCEVNAGKYIMTYLYGNDNYEKMIEETGDVFNEVSPNYFDIDKNGNLKLNTIDVSFIEQMHKKGIKVVPFLSNHWNREYGRRALENVDKLTTQITNAVINNNLDGVNIDIENVTEKDRENYSRLVKLLREKLPKEKFVVVSVAANPYYLTTGWHGSYDYKTLGQYSDYIMVMAYDEHYEGGTPGPVASIEFVENAIKYAIENVPKEKIVLGIPFYGRYWNVDEEYGGKAVSLKQMEEILKKYESDTTYNYEKEAPAAKVIIKECDEKIELNSERLISGTYEFWYENDKSIDAKLKMIEKYNLKGIGIWKLGLENTVVWDKIDTYFCDIVQNDMIFKDVSKSHWAYEEISNVREKNLIIGKGKEMYAPEDMLTRAELITIVDRIIENRGEIFKKYTETNNEMEMRYEDIGEHWAKKSIEKLTEYKIVEGYKDNTFKPDKYVSRAEASKVICNLLDLDYKECEKTYKDVKKEHWAYEDIIKLSNYNILNGYEDGNFKPDDCITRAEIAKIVYEIYTKFT